MERGEVTRKREQSSKGFASFEQKRGKACGENPGIRKKRDSVFGRTGYEKRLKKKKRTDVMKSGVLLRERRGEGPEKGGEKVLGSRVCRRGENLKGGLKGGATSGSTRNQPEENGIDYEKGGRSLGEGDVPSKIG